MHEDSQAARNSDNFPRSPITRLYRHFPEVNIDT